MQKERQIDRLIFRYIDIYTQKERQIDRLIFRYIDRYIEKNRQIGMQTNRLIDIQIGGHIYLQMSKCFFLNLAYICVFRVLSNIHILCNRFFSSFFHISISSSLHQLSLTMSSYLSLCIVIFESQFSRLNIKVFNYVLNYRLEMNIQDSISR